MDMQQGGQSGIETTPDEDNENAARAVLNATRDGDRATHALVVANVMMLVISHNVKQFRYSVDSLHHEGLQPQGTCSTLLISREPWYFQYSKLITR